MPELDDPAARRRARARAGWDPPGPVPPGAQGQPDLRPGPGETLSCFAGHWQIFQLKDGHRYSTDDLLAAAFALETLRALDRTPGRALDLGAGIGSVGLFLAWALPELELVGLERQAISVALARRSARYNGVEGRVTFLEGDLRAEAAPGPFEVVTGSPPYWAPEDGILSEGPQKGSARFEVTGTVEDYCARARASLTPTGVFSLVFDGRQRPRLEAALKGAGLHLLRIQDVLPKEGRPPLMVLASASPTRTQAPLTLPPLTLRLAGGERSPAFRALRLRMGMPPGRAPVTSPEGGPGAPG